MGSLDTKDQTDVQNTKEEETAVSENAKVNDNSSKEESKSIERPRRGRACKEIAEILKVAEKTPPKQLKEKKIDKDKNKNISEKKGKAEEIKTNAQSEIRT